MNSCRIYRSGQNRLPTAIGLLPPLPTSFGWLVDIDFYFSFQFDSWYK
jgi:hypothetical protein